MEKKTRIPRKLKKQITKAQIIIDYNSIPNFMGESIYERIKNQMTMFNKNGLLLWDSSNTGAIKPEIIGVKSKLKIVDKNK